MARPAPMDPVMPTRWTTAQYRNLVAQGVLGPEDRVELLEGVIVAMPPHNEPHAAGVRRLGAALHRAIGDRATVQIQLTLLAGSYSAPEPDAAVLPGAVGDYDRTLPAEALLVVEVADTSLKQDRLTKAAIYAAARIPEYWIVNLRDDCIEVRRAPDADARRYTAVVVARRGERIEIATLPGVWIVVDDLLPSAGR